MVRFIFLTQLKSLNDRRIDVFVIVSSTLDSEPRLNSIGSDLVRTEQSHRLAIIRAFEILAITAAFFLKMSLLSFHARELIAGGYLSLLCWVVLSKGYVTLTGEFVSLGHLAPAGRIFFYKISDTLNLYIYWFIYQDLSICIYIERYIDLYIYISIYIYLASPIGKLR